MSRKPARFRTCTKKVPTEPAPMTTAVSGGTPSRKRRAAKSTVPSCWAISTRSGSAPSGMGTSDSSATACSSAKQPDSDGTGAVSTRSPVATITPTPSWPG